MKQNKDGKNPSNKEKSMKLKQKLVEISVFISTFLFIYSFRYFSVFTMMVHEHDNIHEEKKNHQIKNMSYTFFESSFAT